MDTVFGIPGAHMYDFNDALAQRRDALRFITTRHEQGAGYMAYGYAKSTGRPGVYTVVPGPGLLNSAAALCTAYGATAPVLCITGNIMSHLIGRGRGQLHELPDQLALVRGLTKWAERIDHPTEAPRVMAEAFRRLASGRVRPVAVEAPWDVFGMKAEVTPAAPLGAERPPTPDPETVAAAARLIAAAKRPLITVGAGALHAGEAVLALARLLQAPVTAHRSGRGIVSDDSPYGMRSVAAYEYWKDADLLIGIGSRLELQHFRWRFLPRGVKVVRIDIDPTEMVRLAPDVGLVTDAALGTRALIAALEPLVGRRVSREAEFEEIKSARRRRHSARAAADGLPRCDSPGAAARRLFRRRDLAGGIHRAFRIPRVRVRGNTSPAAIRTISASASTPLSGSRSRIRARPSFRSRVMADFCSAARSWQPPSSTRSISSPSSSTTAVTATCAAISRKNTTGGCSARI